MLGVWQLFVTGVALGLSIAAPPGPVNATAIYQATRSWFSGWSTLLGATTADAVFFLLTYFGLASLVGSGILRDLLFAVGGCFMFYLALVTFRGARREPREDRKLGEPYVLGLTIGLSNPFQIAWWVTVGIGMVTAFGFGIFFGFFTGIVLWTLIFPTMLREGLRRYKDVYRYLVYVSGFVLLGFAVWFLSTAASSLL